MAQPPLHQALRALPESNFTTRVLSTMSRMVDTDWKNVTGLAEMIRAETGESDEAYIQEIGERAVVLFSSEEQRYQRALTLFQRVDDLDKIAGTASLAAQAGERFSFLGFLDRLTPRDETTQAIDGGVKLAAELATFCLINGIPGDSVAEFTRSLARYSAEDRLRVASWIAIDGLMPLGPNFVQRIRDGVRSADTAKLQGSRLFQQVTAFLPGRSAADKKGLIVNAIDSAGDWIQGATQEWGLDRDTLSDRFSRIINKGDRGFDAIAAALDVGTNYFEHTGTQTVARQIVSRAYGEV